MPFIKINKQFVSEVFGNVRARVINGEAWFIAKDVCKALEIKNVSDAVERLDDDEKGIVTSYTRGGEQTKFGSTLKKFAKLLSWAGLEKQLNDWTRTNGDLKKASRGVPLVRERGVVSDGFT